MSLYRPAPNSRSLPFVIGRTRVAHEANPQRRSDLLVNKKVPFRRLRNHFMILLSHDRFIVHDMSSTLGTIFNGRAISRHFASDDAELRAGKNVIIA